MDYKYTICEDEHVIMIDDEHFFEKIKGNNFLNHITEVFPDAEGNFIRCYKVQEGDYLSADGIRTLGNTEILDEIPEEDWEDHQWPIEEKEEQDDEKEEDNNEEDQG